MDADFTFVSSVTDPQQIQVNKSQFIEDITRKLLLADSLRMRNASLYLISAKNNKFAT